MVRLKRAPAVSGSASNSLRLNFDGGPKPIPAYSLTDLWDCAQAGRSDFFPNPEEFDPENFLGRKVKPRDWVPFGGGSRMCTGMGLAQLELAVVLATIVQRVDLELGPGSTEPRRDGLTFQPANGLQARVVRKLPRD